MKEGDLFKWTFKPHAIAALGRNQTLIYWCCARIAEFKDGRLRDLYWSNLADGKNWSAEEATERLDLEYLGNRSELVKCHHPDYYRGEDIVDLTHPNSYGFQIYKRKGAQRSREAMKELTRNKIERARRDIESLEHDVKYLVITLESLNLDDTDLSKMYI